MLQPLAVRLSAHIPGLEARRHELFGIGLVLVPLLANRLWAGGVGRGAFQVAVQAALVALALRGLLIPFTNFALAGFDPTYDPLALAFLTSPRAQMTLLVTAALASVWNRRFGWDYHGILVPALLGLSVLAPIKLLATVVEALAILLVTRGLLRLPRLRTLNVEGARRVVLCFCVGVAFKMATARLAVAHLPGYRPTDLLGFGYVLPSLLAERISARAELGAGLRPHGADGAGRLRADHRRGGRAGPGGAGGTGGASGVPLAHPGGGRAAAARGGSSRADRAGDSTGRPTRAADAPRPRRSAGARAGGAAVGATRVLIAPLDEQAILAAVVATRAGSALVLGEPEAARGVARALALEPGSRRRPAEPAPRVFEPWRLLARRAAAQPGAGQDPGVATFGRECADPDRLAATPRRSG